MLRAYELFSCALALSWIRRAQPASVQRWSASAIVSGGGCRSVDDVCEVSDDTIDEDKPAMTNFGLLNGFFAGMRRWTSICTHGLILSAFENPTARNASGTVAPVHLRRNLTADWTRGSL